MTRRETHWQWWKHGVIYQIYPRSFRDTNGDGVGDLPGVIEKLDYLVDLGVDGIWLSPINTSPMFDFGYDVADYRGIDPLFGTLEDLERLVDEAHRRDLRIVMDLVLNHTSHEHAWFRESRGSRDNPKSDWYIWRDGAQGRRPNNWQAMFGGRAWTWDDGRKQYYLHSFLAEQPDLNWRSPEVREAVFADIRFWLDRGVDGFRLDVINFLLKDPELRDNPFGLGPSPRPYDLQKHVHDRDQPDNLELMSDLRRLMDEYPERMTVGEIFAATPDPGLSATYVGDGSDRLHLAFDFSIMYRRRWHARTFFEVLTRWYQSLPEGAWPCVVLSNHDQPRSRSRFGGGRHSLARAQVGSAFLLTVRGTPFLYYGEELGMENGKIRRSELRDPVGLRYWPLHPGRDPVRTPMPWSAEEHAGFSSTTPWLPLERHWREQNVEAQEHNPDSMLHFHRKLLRLRRQHPALHRGSWQPLNDGRDDTLAYLRIWEDETILVVLNFSQRVKRVDLTAHEVGEPLFSNRKIEGSSGDISTLEAHEVSLYLVR